ncbi:HECT-like protein [Artemisia annua]|uniref:HECT-type E3 ubiquitin transferase n=1 Tax=Artemisia annua TaxID=35608 RepID=A0A2U1PDQ9_ARTAN|nr:HECT-like protein [Artemisia annua]
MVSRDIDSASVYFDMFVASCAPEALVMLYLYDKHRALDSVTHFFTSSKDELDLPIYYDLASKIALHDLFPFVDELANKLSQGLVSSVDSIIGPSSTDVHDFETFSRFVIKAIVDPMALETLIPVHYHCNHPRYNHQLSYLYSLFLDLLEKLQTCLAKVGDDIKFNPKFKRDGGWDQYFSILKLLHYIAQLYEGAEEIFWTSLKPNKAAFSYIIVNYAKRRDEGYKWILDRKDMTDFKSRRHLVMMLLPEVTHDYDNLHEMLINRSNLLAESFESITGAEIAALHGPMHIGFINEEATGPGVLREWFLLVCQAIFNPQNALFVACPTDRRRFFPNPLSKVDPMHLEYFIFAGRVIALALMRKMQVGIVFSRAFFLQLAGIDVSLEDIKDADPYLYSSCKQILDMDPCVIDQDVLGLTFIWEVEELGSKKVVELLPDGKNISVNSVNRKVYIDLLIRHQFVTSIAKQVSKFAQGFADIVSNEETRKLFYKSLELEDLDGMLHGSESVISVDDWKAHTEYDGYKETDPQICWFWQIVGEMSAEQRKVLLFFWTSVKYLPVEGFCGLASRLCITKTNETIDLLPSSHTCFYQICFPAYPSMTVMQQRLNIITQEHIGCSFGTW